MVGYANNTAVPSAPENSSHPIHRNSFSYLCNPFSVQEMTKQNKNRHFSFNVHNSDCINKVFFLHVDMAENTGDLP